MTYEKMTEDFKAAFKNMELHYETSWTEEGTDSYGRAYFGWQDPYVAVFFDNYYIYVYLLKDGRMLISWARGDEDTQQGAELFEPGDYNGVKTFVWHFMDAADQEDRDEEND